MSTLLLNIISIYPFLLFFPEQTTVVLCQAELYKGMAPEVILKLLLHKIGRAMEEDGVAAAGGMSCERIGH